MIKDTIGWHTVSMNYVDHAQAIGFFAHLESPVQCQEKNKKIEDARAWPQKPKGRVAVGNGSVMSREESVPMKTHNASGYGVMHPS